MSSPFNIPLASMVGSLLFASVGFSDQNTIEAIFPPQTDNSGYCLVAAKQCRAMGKDAAAFFKVANNESSNGKKLYKALTRLEGSLKENLAKSLTEKTQCIEPSGKFVAFHATTKHGGKSYVLMGRNYESLNDECYFRGAKDFM